MIIILGSGYLAKTYARYFLINSIPHKLVSRKEIAYNNPNEFSSFLSTSKATLLINATGYTNQNSIVNNKLICLYVNTILPGSIAEICATLNIPCIHFSSNFLHNAHFSISNSNKNSDLSYLSNDPNYLDYTTRDLNYITYENTKLLGEELLQKYNNVYICRLAIPFSNNEDKRNYLTYLCTTNKIIEYESGIIGTDSLININDLVEATYHLWHSKADFGTYDIANSGTIKNIDIITKLIKKGLRKDVPEQEIVYKLPRRLDNSKIKKIFHMPDVCESIDRALFEWAPI